jgi:hypothetical protein
MTTANKTEDWMLGMIDSNNRHRHLNAAIKRKKKGHTLIEYRKSVSEFKWQCNSHTLFRTIFYGFPVYFRALENSIPLGEYKISDNDSSAVRLLKQEINNDIRAAQGKLISKGCNEDDPDYLLLWRDENGQLQGLLIEFKKEGQNSRPSQRARHEIIFGLIKVPTRIAHNTDEAYALVQEYKIPNRGRGLF